MSNWERIHNPSFNYGEFAVIKSKAGLHNYKISALENLNAHFIQEGISQRERLERLNKTAIYQMKLLTKNDGLERLEQGGTL